MSFLEVFDPGLRHWREYKELQKVLVHRTDQGGPGPQPVDLESGVIVVVLPEPAADGAPEIAQTTATEAEPQDEV